ncbi:MAG TPA: RDD family protein [Bacilli bacterium]|nr:RDD family protein [Bacilli bacterium]
MINEEPMTNEIKLEYFTPPFYRRVLANVIDAIFFLLSFIGLFIGVREIVTSTQEYKTNIVAMAQIKVDSCLYIPDIDSLKTISKIKEYIEAEEKVLPEDIKDVVDIVSVLNNTSLFGTSVQLEGSQAAISGFHDFVENVCTPEDYAIIIADYETFMLSDELVDGDGIHYFIKDVDEKIVINPECAERDAVIYSKGYAAYIDEHAQGYLLTSVPTYYEYSRYLSDMLLFIEIPISYSIAGLLIFLLPVLIFRRGRMTFGKAIYRIGSVDANFFSPKIGRTLARFFIFYFAELILSLLTFGVPFIISFSLMVFSKKKQGFPDYMLGILEVDCYRTKIFISKEEIALKGINTHSKAVDFKVREKL